VIWITFPIGLTACAFSRKRDEVGDRHGVGQPFVRGNLMNRPQMGIPLGIAATHYILSNRFWLAKFR
jgi:hypothetical protein